MIVMLTYFAEVVQSFQSEAINFITVLCQLESDILRDVYSVTLRNEKKRNDFTTNFFLRIVHDFYQPCNKSISSNLWFCFLSSSIPEFFLNHVQFSVYFRGNILHFLAMSSVEVAINVTRHPFRI